MPFAASITVQSIPLWLLLRLTFHWGREAVAGFPKQWCTELGMVHQHLYVRTPSNAVCIIFAVHVQLYVTSSLYVYAVCSAVDVYRWDVCLLHVCWEHRVNNSQKPTRLLALLCSIPLSFRISRINFDMLAQDQHIKPSLSQIMDRILEKLFLANIKGSYMIFKKINLA